MHLICEHFILRWLRKINETPRLISSPFAFSLYSVLDLNSWLQKKTNPLNSVVLKMIRMLRHNTKKQTKLNLSVELKLGNWGKSHFTPSCWCTGYCVLPHRTQPWQWEHVHIIFQGCVFPVVTHWVLGKQQSVLVNAQPSQRRAAFHLFHTTVVAPLCQSTAECPLPLWMG